MVPLANYLRPDDTYYVLRKIHEGTYRNHSNVDSLSLKVLLVGYSWPTIKGDTKKFTTKYDKCQCFTYQLCQSIKMMHVIVAPWTFMK